jgi:hypothetical protein
MKDKNLKKYLPLFISIFMILTFLGLSLFGGYLFLIMMSDITNSGLRFFGFITLFIGWSAWYWLGVLIERKLKIQIFRRGLYDLYPIRNLLKIVFQKHGSSTDEMKKKGNSYRENRVCITIKL